MMFESFARSDNRRAKQENVFEQKRARRSGDGQRKSRHV
jgi:hypothetical protein